MSATILFFISSGIFLGWSLGANHAVNVFGTAVMSKMVRFRVAAVVAGIFVILGSVLGGAGTTRTLNQLGAVNALAGSFTVALAVGISVAWMTHLKLPVSTSQAIVGGIIGWNLFTGSPTDSEATAKILSTWLTSPLLAAAFAFLLYKGLRVALGRARIHLLEIDAYTRAGLLIVGALASYALGANNIANVMGLFVPAAPFADIVLYGTVPFSGTQQLFLIGGTAIAVGIYTYGYKVMVTVGSDLYRITPLSGLVVVLAESLVLFLFSSETLEALLLRLHLPTIPLVPLSSTQAVIGAVVGVGLAKQGRMLNLRVLGKIGAGWIFAPTVSLVLTFVLLFFVQNVFEQRVIADSEYHLSRAVVDAAAAEGVAAEPLQPLVGRSFSSANELKGALERRHRYPLADMIVLLRLARIDSMTVDTAKVPADSLGLGPEQMRGLRALHRKVYLHAADLDQALASHIVVRDSASGRLAEGLTPTQREALKKTFRHETR
jgi:inorganic phosphate transporter, PiT family